MVYLQVRPDQKWRQIHNDYVQEMGGCIAYKYLKYIIINTTNIPNNPANLSLLVSGGGGVTVDLLVMIVYFQFEALYLSYI